jgi:rhodanese-related sulfurtransferase
MSMLHKNKTYYIHCAGGYRSLIACSILKARGFDNVINIKGGFKILATTALNKSGYVAPRTML